jgi:hypothetical protein
VFAPGQFKVFGDVRTIKRQRSVSSRCILSPSHMIIKLFIVTCQIRTVSYGISG